MQTVAMITQKGGTGKTTFTLNCAVAALEDGLKSLIIDIDMQASACSWADRRAKANHARADQPLVIDAQPARLASALEKAEGLGIAFVLIDTPAKSGDAGLAAARLADLVLIPCRPQMIDIETIKSTKDILRLANSPPALVLLNAAPPVGFKRVEDARKAVEKYDVPVCPHAVSQRAVFGDATALGQSVLEYEPEGLAAQEIRNVYNYIRQLLGKQVIRVTDTGENHGQTTTRSRRAS